MEKYTWIRSSHTSWGGIPESADDDALFSTDSGAVADDDTVIGLSGGPDHPTRQGSRLNEHSSDRDSQ